MALHIYRYQRTAARSNSSLRNESDPTATTTAQLETFTDIQVDDTKVADLDAFMADLGYTNIATDPLTTVLDAFAAITLGAGAPVQIDAGDLAVAGVSSKGAHADHQHPVSTAALANLGAQVVGVGSAGASTTLPRGDHIHPMASAAPGATIDAGDAAVEGAAVTVARTDHQHAVNTLTAPAVPAAVAAVSNAGVAATLVRGDHVHSVPIEWRTYQALWLKDLADATAATLTAERGFDRNGMVAAGVWTFVNGVYVPSAAVAASAVNFATLTIVVRTAAGAVVGTLATVTTVAGWAAGVPVALVAGAVAVVNPGEYVTIIITKTGTGAVVPAGVLEVTLTVS